MTFRLKVDMGLVRVLVVDDLGEAGMCNKTLWLAGEGMIAVIIGQAVWPSA
jgi:hypothetical protein